MILKTSPSAYVPIGRGPGVADAVVRARHSVLAW
jgi:hypothetical protein